jgi:hypothetical protein
MRIEQIKKLYNSVGVHALRENEIVTLINAIIAERDNALAQNAEQLAVIEYAYNKLYILSHNRKDVSARLLGDADKGFEAVRAYLSLNKTPTQHLRDRDAEAGRAGYQQGIHEWRTAEMNYKSFDITFASTEYAEKVRRGEV